MQSREGFAFASDFDGTITEKDVAAMLLHEFADEKWLDVEEDFRNRKLSCRETLKREFELLQGGKQQLIEYVDRHARIDPNFKPFLSLCEKRGIPVRIVSEGLDFYIEHLLGKHGIEIDFFTNRAHFENGGIRISFPNSSEECDDCGTCKLQLLKDWKEEGKGIVYAGDGVSDICPAESADVVFAKGDLLSHFKKEGLDHIEFKDFRDIISEMERW
ncbi:MAG: MtnX-like HAD-IB family phosphatase [Thermoplasmata archaeon]